MDIDELIELMYVSGELDDNFGPKEDDKNEKGPDDDDNDKEEKK